jgi:hypothetical protein
MRLFANFNARDNLRNISLASWEIFLYTSNDFIFVNRFVHFHKYYGDIKITVLWNMTPYSLVGTNDADECSACIFSEEKQ